MRFPSPIKVALYARVSTIGEGQNPETQLMRLRHIAEARGWTIHKEYVDHASGKDQNRPAFQQLMGDAKAHAFDIILVTRLDRMMRSVKNLLNVIEQLDHYSISFECTEQPLSTNGAAGRLFLNITAAFAEFERELIVERSAEGTERAKAEGKLCHRPKGAKDTKKRRSRKGALKRTPSLLSNPAQNQQEVNSQ